MSLKKNAIEKLGEKNLATRLAAGTAALALALTVAACGGAPAQTDAPADDAPAQQQAAQISVTVEIDATAGEGELSTHAAELDEGATAYDALVATAEDVNASDSEYGMYVSGINGLAAGDFGETSGWLYSVNGEEAQVACSEYTLESGDVVTWTYVTEF